MIYALAVFIVVLPDQVVLAGPLHSNGWPAKFTINILIALVAFGIAGSQRSGTTMPVKPGLALVMTYFCLQLLVWGVGAARHASTYVQGQRLPSLLILLGNTALMAFVIIRINTWRHRSRILGLLAIGLTLSCITALLQAFSDVELRYLFKFPGFVLNTLGDQGRGLDLGGRSFRFGSPRTTGMTGGYLVFATLSAVTVPLALHFARFANSRGVRQLSWAAALIALLSMPTAGSRTGVVALVAAMLVYVWNVKVVHVAAGLATGGLALALGAMASPKTANALWLALSNASLDSEDASVQSRIDAFARVSATFHDHPLFGLGLGAVPPLEYGFLDNEWLGAIAQGGIVGFAALLLLGAAIALGMAGALRSAASESERSLVYAMGAMATGIFVTGFTFDVLGFAQTRYVLLLLIGLLWSAVVIKVPTRVPVSDRALPPAHVP